MIIPFVVYIDICQTDGGNSCQNQVSTLFFRRPLRMALHKGDCLLVQLQVRSLFGISPAALAHL